MGQSTGCAGANKLPNVAAAKPVRERRSSESSLRVGAQALLCRSVAFRGGGTRFTIVGGASVFSGAPCVVSVNASVLDQVASVFGLSASFLEQAPTRTAREASRSTTEASRSASDASLTDADAS